MIVTGMYERGTLGYAFLVIAGATTVYFGICFAPEIYQALKRLNENLAEKKRAREAAKAAALALIPRPSPPTPPLIPLTDISQKLDKELSTAVTSNNLPVPPTQVKAWLIDAGNTIYTQTYTDFVTGTTEEQSQKSQLFNTSKDRLLQAIIQSLTAFLKRLPVLQPSPLSIPIYELASISYAIYEVIEPFRVPELEPLPTVLAAFNANVGRVTAAEQSRTFLYPQDYKGPRHKIVDEYLRGTPFQKLFSLTVPYPIDDKMRFEHHWIIANSGHGKTQTLQHLIADDLKRVAKDEISIVVIDSENKLIPNIASLEVFAPGQPLHDRLVLIDPANATPAINLFQMGKGKNNQALEFYRFMFGSLLDSPMTDNQRTLFDNCALLLQHVPDATFMTFYHLLDGEDFSEYYPDLDDIGQRFFRRDFSSKGVDGYEPSRKQIIRRLNAVMRSPFGPTLAQSENTLDIGAAMAGGKVVLVNTNAPELGKDSSRLFGRFFMALAANAATRRASSKPCFVYIDEADKYCKSDPTTEELLARARKNNVGLILAHRWLDEMGTTVRALESVASIIFAGGLRADDRAHMVKVMECDPSLLSGSKGNFAVYLRGKPVVSINVPFLTMEKAPHMTPAAYRALLAEQARLYGAKQKSTLPPLPTRRTDTYDDP